MCIRDRLAELDTLGIPTHHSDDGWYYPLSDSAHSVVDILRQALMAHGVEPVSYTHLRAHETVLDLVCRLLLEKKKKTH